MNLGDGDFKDATINMLSNRALSELTNRVSRSVGLSHYPWWAGWDPAAYRVLLACRCGWKRSIPAESLTGRGFAHAFILSLDEHLDDVVKEHDTTIAALTDWGWFCPEAT